MTAIAPRDALRQLGYEDALIDETRLDPGGPALVVGFAHEPMTKRNACVALVEASAAEAATVAARTVELTGCSVVGTICNNVVQLWRANSTGATTLAEDSAQMPLGDLAGTMGDVLDPRRIYRAKTYGRYDRGYQLDFVDIGLLTSIEEVQGADLQRFLERIVAEVRPTDVPILPEEGHQVLTIAFWVLAARLLRDHGVPAFQSLDSTDGLSVLRAVQQHYRGIVPMLAYAEAWRGRVNAAASLAWADGRNWRLVGPEAISHVYESSLIAEKTRADLGTHSTPPFLVEYILGRLREHIQRIPVDERLVIEPACGHGAFLVSALRVLVEDLPSDTPRHAYLQQRLRGAEIDEAAREMARLSLTLADVPNPNGWDLRGGDMFLPGELERLAADATVLLSNPPFEKFEQADRQRLDTVGARPVRAAKPSEMLRRVLPLLKERAVVGLVLPRNFLSGPQDRETRTLLLTHFRILEVCVFPDKVFQFSDQECAVILGVRALGGAAKHPVIFRRVRERGMAEFRASAVVSDEEEVSGTLFTGDAEHRMVLPELRRVWSSRRWPILGGVAEVGQGLSHRGAVRNGGAPTIETYPFPGAVRGLLGFRSSADLYITDPPRYGHVDLTPSHLLRPRSGLPTGQPQVVLNLAPRSRGPWRLTAFMEREGVAVPSTWLVVRPHDPSVWPIEVLWAILNSPVANAFVYAHSAKRHVYSTTLERLPLPYLSSADRDAVVALVRRILTLSGDDTGDAFSTLDARILAGYGLFAPGEQRIVRLFDDETRPGLRADTYAVPPVSRYPAYLAHRATEPDFPLDGVVGDYAQVRDIDAEIDDGRRELAALRPLAALADCDPRVTRRIAFVRAALRRLEEHAASRWVSSPADAPVPPRHNA